MYIVHTMKREVMLPWQVNVSTFQNWTGFLIWGWLPAVRKLHQCEIGRLAIMRALAWFTILFPLCWSIFVPIDESAQGNKARIAYKLIREVHLQAVKLIFIT